MPGDRTGRNRTRRLFAKASTPSETSVGSVGLIATPRARGIGGVLLQVGEEGAREIDRDNVQLNQYLSEGGCLTSVHSYPAGIVLSPLMEVNIKKIPR